LASVAAQVFRIASNQDLFLQELADVIKSDPALTSKLLKIVNSAFYGNHQQISTVKQAVLILGGNEIVDIAFALATARVFNVKPVPGAITPKELWRHSISTAVVAHHLSQRFLQDRVPGMFTAGLLHDMGKIFLLEQFPHVSLQVYRKNLEQNIPVFEIEEEFIGMSHAKIGQMLSAGWNLPRPIVEIIGYHHEPALARHHPTEAALIGLADDLCHRLENNSGDEENTISFHSNLTYGHHEVLRTLPLDMCSRDLTRDAALIIEENNDLIQTLF